MLVAILSSMKVAVVEGRRCEISSLPEHECGHMP